MSRQARLVALRDRLAREALETIRADAAAAPWPLQGLLLELAQNLFDCELHVGKVWQRLRQKDHSLSSRFASRFGHTPKAYLERHRMQIAAKLLEHPELRGSIEQVGRAVGYSDLRTFQRCFQRCFGVGPGAYRQAGVRVAPPCPPETTLAALSDAQLKTRLRGAVAKLAPDRVCEGWIDLLESVFAFSTPALFEQLIELSRELGRRDRQLGIHLAEKAVASLDQLRGKLPEPELAALEARGWAWVGNAQRLAYDFEAAEAAFERAVAACPAGRFLLVEAEVLDLLGYLRLDQRRLKEALELMERALAVCRRAGTSKRLVEILLDHAEILRLEGDLAPAIASLEEACALIDARADFFLALTTFQKLALIRLELGAIDDASALLPVIKDLSRRAGHPQAAMQVLWLEGLILAGRGEARRAFGLLHEAREGFFTLHDTGNAAMIALDLAELGIGFGQPAEAVALATEAVAVLQDLVIEREALAALRLLQQALEAGRLTTPLLRETRAGLARTRQWKHPTCENEPRASGDGPRSCPEQVRLASCEGRSRDPN